MDPDEYQALVDAHGPPPSMAEMYGPSPEIRDWLLRDDPAEDDGPEPPEPGPAEPLPPDPPAGKVKRGPRARPGGRSSSSSPPRITQAVRNDITGKLGLLLQVGGTAWQARDPVCGGAFLAQLPATVPATVDLILLSPDLVVWFTGVGGGFMLWFNLLAALWPVAGTVWAHHGPGADERRAQDEDDAAAAGRQAYAA